MKTDRAEFDCSAVIVNYHSEGLLAECLASLEADRTIDGLDVVVVDNSATLLRSGLRDRFPHVRMVENDENVGFARAANQGLQLARGRHLLLLNPDTVIRPGALRALVQHLDAHPEVGAVGPRLLNPDGSLQFSCRRFPGYLTIFFGRYSPLTRLLPWNPVSRRYLYLDWDHRSTADVDWLSGACLMVRRDVLERVGPLDEEYFLFVEDMDWCRRIRDAGWSIAYVPAAVVTHRVGASRGPQPARVVWARHRGMLHYVRKHFHSPMLVEALVGAGLMLKAGFQVFSNSLRGMR